MTLEMPASEAARYEASTKEIFGKMDQLRKQMKRDQSEIEKSQKRTRAKLAKLSASMR